MRRERRTIGRAQKARRSHSGLGRCRVLMNCIIRRKSTRNNVWSNLCTFLIHVVTDSVQPVI